MKEYIIHGTFAKNVESILKSGYIEANKNKRLPGMLDESQSVNQIFTQLVYRNLPNENNQISHWCPYCFILDIKILKDYPFYATGIGSFCNKFSDAFIKNAKKIYLKGKGNLKKIPNLKKLKEEIEKHLIDFGNNNTTFMHSHEILFGKRISLKKYCKMILTFTGTKIPENIILLAAKLNIPIKYHNHTGLNYLVDLVDL